MGFEKLTEVEASDLTTVEHADLLRYEAVISRGLETFVKVGNALLAIRRDRLYRATHATFEAYCQQRWQMTGNYANRLMGAAEVVGNLSETVPIGTILPATESQARPLAALDPEQQRDAWTEAVETAPDGKPTAAYVERTVERLRHPKPVPTSMPVPPVYVDGEQKGVESANDEKPEVPPDLHVSGYRLWNHYSDGEGRQWRWQLKKGFDNVAWGPFAWTPDEAIAGMRTDSEQRKAERKENAKLLNSEWSESELSRRKRVEEGETVHANMKTDLALIDWAKSNDLFERVDRATIWGNPFLLPSDGDRQTVVENYQWYLKRKPSLLGKIDTIRGKVLGCWCYPEMCHGKVLEDYANDAVD